MTVMLPNSMSFHVKTAAQTLDGDTFQRLAGALVESETQSVMLSVHGERGVGGVFVDEGRIAWAAAPGTRHFLTDRLVSAGADGNQMQELLAEARRTGVPLGQLVVDRGLMKASAFAEVLYEHTVESLSDMTSQRVSRIEPHARRGGTFAMAFTFPMVPVLAETARRVVPSRAVVPQVGGDPLIAVELSVVDGRPVPVRVLGAHAPKLSELLSLVGDAQAVISGVGAGTVSFRRGERCWSVSGNQSSFVVSEGRSLLSFSWMLGQGGL